MLLNPGLYRFELPRIGELVLFKMKMHKLRKKIKKAGGDVWFAGDSGVPIENTHYPVLEKMLLDIRDEPNACSAQPSDSAE